MGYDCMMFGDILQELRKDKGWKQADLAKQLNLSPSTVGSYENAVSEPTFENLIKISDLFEVNIDYLLGHSREPLLWSDLNQVIELETGEVTLYAVKEALQSLSVHDRTIVVETLMKLKKLKRLEEIAKKEK